MKRHYTIDGPHFTRRGQREALLRWLAAATAAVACVAFIAAPPWIAYLLECGL